MSKMLRSRKQFGRCRVQGHGSNCFCEVCSDIQGTEFTRSQDKREWKEEIYNMLQEEVVTNLEKLCKSCKYTLCECRDCRNGKGDKPKECYLTPECSYDENSTVCSGYKS